VGLVAKRVPLGADVVVLAPMTGWRSFLLQPRLAPALAEVAGALGSIAGKLDAEAISTVAPFVGRAFAKLPPVELEAITRELLDGAMFLAGGKTPGAPLLDTLDAAMQGRTLDVWRLLFEAVRLNYPDFFKALGGSVAPSGAAVSPSEGSNT